LAALIALALLITGAAPAGAEESPEKPDPKTAKPEPEKKDGPGPEKKREPAFLSSWGDIVISRCSTIAFGTVIKLYSLPTGTTVATFRYDEIIFGAGATGGEILVLTSDPRFLKTGDALILFLVPESDGDRFRALDKIDLKAKGGELRAGVVRRFLAMEAMKDPASRRAEFKNILFENLSRPDRWCRDNAIRELYIFTEREPETFTEEETVRIRKEALARKSETARTKLGYALAHLEVLLPLRRVLGTDEEEARKGMAQLEALMGEIGIPAERIRYREDVVFQQYRASADPAVRASIIRTASELGRARFLTGVLKATMDDDHRVRIEALRGAARFGSRRASKLVARRLGDAFPAVRAQAARTLGVIGSEADVPALRRLATDEKETAEVREAADRAIAAIEAGG